MLLNVMPARQIWAVGALCHAAADTLDARFNPVTVEGELSGLTRAASGHCYFSLKDAQGQLRCAMFRRAALGLDFAPRDGERVQVRGRLGVYEPRGDLQLVVEAMRPVGQGTLFEQFLQLKAKLSQEGLFDPSSKRPVPALPRCIGVVTSLGAAALQDVLTALQRRVPHIPVLLAPAAVQGAAAPQEIVQALHNLYQHIQTGRAQTTDLAVDVILLVRGGGALEDLWAFNDEQVVRTVARSPVPIIVGVGHETDFTLAEFAADLRAPTPTAAAELAATSRTHLLQDWQALAERQHRAGQRVLQQQQQGLDQLALRLGRPSARVSAQARVLDGLAQRLPFALRQALTQQWAHCERQQTRLQHAQAQSLAGTTSRLAQGAARLHALDPRLVLQRGYAWLADANGKPLVQAARAHIGQTVVAQLADGRLDLTVSACQLASVDTTDGYHAEAR